MKALATPQNLVLLCYFLAISAQLVASLVALYQVKKVKAYYSGWLLLSLGLTIMVARRVDPIYELITNGHYSTADAVYSLIISLLLMLGVLKIRSLFDLMHVQEIALDKLAKYDTLTGTLRRYAILDQGLMAVERCIRLKRPIAVLVIDIDKFKNINDEYGHSIGDQVLIQFVSLCKNSLRSIDIFGRFGGDEFLAILPEANLETALLIIKRIDADLNNADFIFNNKKLKVTVSTGVGIYDPPSSNNEVPQTAQALLDDLIRNADLDMYDVKKLRRNHI
ncbi:MAG TPA: GGDEF domain-containing protein [Methylotenera sp.]|nr:GGDEF domain-containing protein [Methylotenera sp.]